MAPGTYFPDSEDEVLYNPGSTSGPYQSSTQSHPSVDGYPASYVSESISGSSGHTVWSSSERT